MPIKNYQSEIMCYIVSKCYVIGKNEAYSENHTIEATYRGIFPYHDIGERAKIEYEIFSYGGADYEITIVNNIYDTFEEVIVEINIIFLKNTNLNLEEIKKQKE